ncbi:FUSC family protein [Streptomyces diastatochromogenes]|nr:FUSC family protein [Streptomyces diastatochromogenes]
MRDEATAALRRDLEALRLLVLRPVGEASGTALAQVRNRLLGYREGRTCPRRRRPCRTSSGVSARPRGPMLGLRIALDGPQDESDDTRRRPAPRGAGRRGRRDRERRGGRARGPEPTGLGRPTRAAVQVAVGSALAIAGGELLSSQRWYWAVLTCWIVFLNTASTGEILVKGYRRLIGTVLGVVAGIGLAGLVGHHTWTAFTLVLLCVFAAFYTAPLSYTLMSFFVTAMLGLLYTLLSTYSVSVLVLRVEETALGAACGVIAAAVVLPIHTDRRTNELLVDTLDKLADVTRAAMDQLSGAPPADLVDRARDLDQGLADLRAATQPLTHPIAPQRSRRDTARYVVALLETCAYHAVARRHGRAVADASVDRGGSAAARAGRRIVHNIEAIAAHVADPARRPRSRPAPASRRCWNRAPCAPRATAASPTGCSGICSVWTRRCRVWPGRWASRGSGREVTAGVTRRSGRPGAAPAPRRVPGRSCG